MQHTISKDDTRIAFNQTGQGPALILVAGATTTGSVAQAGLAAALSPHFTVFTYDRRGRGESGDTAPYAVEREIEDLDALIKVAGGSAFVFGHSVGGALTLEAARLLPGKIRKLAVYEPPFTIDESIAPAPPDFVAHLSALLTSGRRGEAVENFLRVVGDTPAQLIAQLQQSPMWQGIEAIAHTVLYDGMIMEDTLHGDPSSLKKWTSVTVPTLILDGTVFAGSAERHRFLNHGASELARIMPHAQRNTLDGQDHVPADEVLAPGLKVFFLG